MNKQKLFCFPFAGGTAAFYDVIEKDLGNIECVKLEYAGHGKRHKEKFYKNFDELADDMLTKLMEGYSGENYGLFGYSMGSIAVIEVLRKIMMRDMKLPDYIFLAAHEPMTRLEHAGFTGNGLDEWVMKKTIEFGAVPEKLINNRVFWRTYLPVYRADYFLIEKYDFDKINIKVDVPATVFYSETDTPASDMSLWEKYFPCEFHQFSGTHFFIEQYHKEMGEIIRKKMGE